MNQDCATDPQRPAAGESGPSVVLLEAIEQGARMGYWWSDVGTGQIHCSAGFNRLLGRKAQPSVHDDLDEFLEAIGPADRTRLAELLTASLTGSAPLDLVCRIQRADDGEVCHLRHRGPVSCTLGAATDALVVTVQDITEEEHQKQLRAEDWDWLDTLVDVVPGMVCVKDGQGRWLAVNHDELETLGLQDVDYRGKTDREIAELCQQFCDMLSACEDTDEAAWQKGTLSRTEERAPTADGRERILETLKIPIFHEDGSRKGLVVMGHDVTERRRTESMNRRLGRILEDSYNEIFVIDQRTSHFVQVNRGARLNLGYTAEQMRQMTPVDISERLTNREDFERRVIPLKEGDQRLLTYESVQVRKDGSTYPVEVRLSLSPNEPDPVYVAVVEDITERKHNERIRDEFVSIVSHELRTPLTPISGVLELLRKAPEIAANDHTSKMVDIAHRNALRLRRLIEQLLDFRKLSLGNATFDMRDLELHEVVSQTAKNTSFLDQRYEFRLEITPPDDELWVWVDRRYLAQLVNILVSNAAKFSPSGSTVTISTRQMGECARLSVADQGPGIPEHMRDHVFDRFVQGDSTSTRHHGGTGMGLSLAKLIVESFGGEISFERNDDGGTTFHVDLPLGEHIFE